MNNTLPCIEQLRDRLVRIYYLLLLTEDHPEFTLHKTNPKYKEEFVDEYQKIFDKVLQLEDIYKEFWLVHKIKTQ